LTRRAQAGNFLHHQFAAGRNMQARRRTTSQDEGPSLLDRYRGHIAALEATMEALPPGQLADRYRQSLEAALAGLAGQRAETQALFAAALAKDADFDLMRGEAAQALSRAYQRLVLESQDALPEAKALELGIALYTIHMLVILFWLYDRSPDQASTGKLIRLAHELFKLLRPLFILPLIPGGIAKLAAIVLPELRRPLDGAAAQDDARDRQHQDFDIHGD